MGELFQKNEIILKITSEQWVPLQAAYVIEAKLFL